MYPASKIWADLLLREGLLPFTLNLILMLLWILLLIFVSVDGQAPAAKKAVVIPSPPWTPVFKGEKVTLNCSGFHLPVPKTLWWSYESQWQMISNPLEVKEAGEYKCFIPGLFQSDPVYLVFSNEALILQIPYYIFEGDTLLLRCREWNDKKLTDISFYKDEKSLPFVSKNPMLSIPHANSEHNGLYYCKAKRNIWGPLTSEMVKLQVQELFPPPELKTTTSEPTEGTPVTLNCETQLPPQRSSTKLHFSFFRDGKVIASGWKESQVFQISAIWREDSGSYWCEAKALTQNIQKQSNHVKINVKIPVSHPLLTLSASGMQAVVGELLEFRCEVLRGSAPIFYQFYHKGLLLKTILAPFGGSVSFNLSVTSENSGNYSCEANNSFSSQLSEMLELSILDPPERGLLIMGVAMSLLSLLVLAAVAILVYFKLKRKSEASPILEPSRNQPITDPQESGHSKTTPTVDLQPVYENVSPLIEDVVYSEVWDMKQGKINTADTSETSPEDKDSSVMYSEVKAYSPNDSIGKDSAMDENHEDVTDNYENVLLS
ncbi:Fc receptor-like protein 4 isoform X3 [Notamacropus eugenii]|uniref:Fc receptor-like protein 4 isoform X3 n=1 Tax=Notamacropus eugenii TaxID=9315 RepID=UPI003B6754BD